jgi:DNA-binding transcriptional LysR family regulator
MIVGCNPIHLGQINLLQEDLRTGRLVAPFETVTTGRREYYVATRLHDAASPEVRKFFDWLVTEANRV